MDAEFLSIVSHELKTPITALKMQLHLARRDANSPHLVGACNQVDRLVQLVDDMLDFSCIQAGKLRFTFAPTCLADVVDRAVQRLQFELANVGCEVKIDVDRNAFGNWDRIRLEQIILNLLANAKKYAPGAPVEISGKRAQKYAVLVVRDYGPGIPLKMHDVIFNRFARGEAHEKISGLGLGLYICRHIVEAHGGTIHVESAEDRGSAFVIHLPYTNNY